MSYQIILASSHHCSAINARNGSFCRSALCQRGSEIEGRAKGRGRQRRQGRLPLHTGWLLPVLAGSGNWSSHCRCWGSISLYTITKFTRSVSGNPFPSLSSAFSLTSSSALRAAEVFITLAFGTPLLPLSPTRHSFLFGEKAATP